MVSIATDCPTDSIVIQNPVRTTGRGFSYAHCRRAVVVYLLRGISRESVSSLLERASLGRTIDSVEASG